jgi:hypothetical protein
MWGGQAILAMLAASQQKVCCNFNNLTRAMAYLTAKCCVASAGDETFETPRLQILMRDEFPSLYATFICIRRIMQKNY